MMEDLEYAARMLGCRIDNERRPYIRGADIAVITGDGIRTINRCHSAGLPADDILVMAADPRMAALVYGRIRKPVWIYFDERRLKGLQLPDKPYAMHVILLTRSGDYAFDVSNRQADRWSREGREVSVLSGITDKDLYDFLNCPSSFANPQI